MPGPEVGRAYVTIIPSLRGAQQTITQELTGASTTAGEAAGKTTGAAMLTSIGNTMQGAGTKLSKLLTVPIVAAGTMAVKNFAEVDKTMSLVNQTMGNTVEQANLINEAMKTAAANSTFGMTDAANAALNFARAGLSAEQAAAALAPAMNLAAGEGGNLDTVSAGLVGTINGFHGSFDDASHYADVFASACNNSALDIDSLSNAMSIAAPIFSAAGLAVDDAALMMGVMANNGIEAGVAANSLKTGLARLVSPAEEGATALEELGINIINADGTMKDSVEIQKELHDAFSNLSESEQIAAASAIFGKNQMAPWLALINTAPEEVAALAIELEGAGFDIGDFSEKLDASGLSINDMRANMEALGVSQEAFDAALNTSGGSAEQFAENLWEAVDPGVEFDSVVGALGGDLDELQDVMDETVGTTDKMADAMMSGFGGGIESLKSSIDVLATSFGEALAPTISTIADYVQQLVNKFQALTPEQKELVANIALVAAAVGPVLLIGGKVIGGIGKIAGGIGGLVGKIGGLGSAASTAAGPVASAATSFGTLAGQALLLIAAGAAVYIIAQAMQVLVNAAISLADAGPLAIATFVGIAVVAVGVTAAIVAIGSAATVSAVGLLAMGAAVLMVSAGIALIIASLTMFVGQLPLVATYGASAAAALLQISVSMITLAASTLYVTAAVAAMAVALAVTTVTFLTVAASTAVMEAAFALLLAELLLVDGEAVLLNAALGLVSVTMDKISKSASDTASKLQEMVTSVGIVEQGLNSLESLASSAISAITSVFQSGMSSLSKTVTSGMSSITSSVTSGMGNVKSTVTQGITAIGASVSSGMSAITSQVASGMTMTSATVTAGVTAISATVSGGVTSISAAVMSGVTSADAAVASGATAIAGYVSTNVANIGTTVVTGVAMIFVTIQTGAANIVQAWGTALNNLASSTRSSMAQVVSTMSSAVDSIASKFANTTLRFNQYIAMPHFYMTGSFNAETGSVPSVGVQWYGRAATEGALFTTPQIIGVGDAAQPELLIGEEKLKELIGGGVQGITVNIYPAAGMDENAIAEKAVRKLEFMLNRRKAVFA